MSRIPVPPHPRFRYLDHAARISASSFQKLERTL